MDQFGKFSGNFELQLKVIAVIFLGKQNSRNMTKIFYRIYVPKILSKSYQKIRVTEGYLFNFLRYKITRNLFLFIVNIWENQKYNWIFITYSFLKILLAKRWDKIEVIAKCYFLTANFVNFNHQWLFVKFVRIFWWKIFIPRKKIILFRWKFTDFEPKFFSNGKCM